MDIIHFEAFQILKNVAKVIRKDSKMLDSIMDLCLYNYNKSIIPPNKMRYNNEISVGFIYELLQYF